MIIVHEQDFLGTEAAQAFLTVAKEQVFVPATKIGHDEHFRKASVCLEWSGFDQFWNIAGRKIIECSLAIGDFDFPNGKPIEMQLTWSKDGDFMGQHRDNARPEIKWPRVTFVYYFGQVDSFSGGELTIGDNITIQPQDDLLVMYPSAIRHGILPVIGDNACRMTINGWSW